MKRKCAVCKFWEMSESVVDGICRINPPTVIEHEGTLKGVFPKTLKDDWCGKCEESETSGTYSLGSPQGYTHKMESDTPSAV